MEHVNQDHFSNDFAKIALNFRAKNVNLIFIVSFLVKLFLANLFLANLFFGAPNAEAARYSDVSAAPQTEK